METTGLEPANADTNASTEAAQVDSEAAVVEGGESATPAAGDSGKPPRDRVQERIDSLTREKYEGLSRAERAEYRAQMLEQRLADLEEKAKPQTVAPSSDYPTLESVGYDETIHRQKVAEWSANLAREAARSETVKEREAAERQQSARTWQQSEAEVIKARPDYVEKVKNAAYLPISDEAQARISRLPDGPLVALALVENAEKARAIMHLPIDVQMLEIGRIAGRIESKPAPVVVSKAPPPVGKIDAGEAAQKKAWNDPDISQEEFNKQRAAQIARRK